MSLDSAIIDCYEKHIFPRIIMPPPRPSKEPPNPKVGGIHFRTPSV